VITVVSSTPLKDHVRCVIYSGYYLHLADVPLSFVGSPSMVLRHHLSDKMYTDSHTGSLSTTAGILGFTRKDGDRGHLIFVSRPGDRGALRLGCGEGEWVSTGLLLRDRLDDYMHYDISLDDSGEHVLLALGDRDYFSTRVKKPSKIALLSLS
jgi:hypothetical protein